MPATHWILALITAAIWGINFVVIAWGLTEFPPFLFCALRFLLTLFPLILFVPRPPVAWRALATFGLSIGVGQFGLLFLAMHGSITPGLASLLIQTQVIFTIMLSWALKRDTVSALQLGAVVLAAAGLAVVAWRSDTGTGASVTPMGLALVTAAAACWALGNLVARSLGTIDVIGFLVWSSLFAVPPLLLLSIGADGFRADIHSLTHASPRAWCAVAWQAAGNSLVGFGLWNWLLARHSSALVTPVGLLVPIFGITSSAWLLGEPLETWKLWAGGLVVCGLGLNAYAGRTKAAPIPAAVRR